MLPVLHVQLARCDQLVEVFRIMHHLHALQAVLLLEDAVADGAAHQQDLRPAAFDQLLVFLDETGRLLLASGQQQRTAATDAAILVHQLEIHTGGPEDLLHGAGDHRRERSHTAGVIQHFLVTHRQQRLYAGEVGEVRRDLVVFPFLCRPIGEPKPAGIHLDLAERRAFAAHQAFLRDLEAATGVAALDVAHVIDGGILDILFLHAHRAGVDADAATRAGIEHRQSKSLAAVADFQSGVAHRDEQDLGRNVHIAGEGQHGQEDAQGQGIGPPGGGKVLRIADEVVEQPVDRDGHKAAARHAGREPLRDPAQREDGPEAVQADAVGEGEFRGAPHPDDAGAEALDDGQGDATENHQQEEVHQEEEERTLQRLVLHFHKVAEKDGVVEPVEPFGDVKDGLDMADDDDHKPAEGDARMHIAQHLVALPEFHVEEAVAEDVLDVLDDRGRGDQQEVELPTVGSRQLDEDLEDAEEAVGQHECHTENERQDKRVVGSQDAFLHHRPSSSFSPYTFPMLRIR